MKCQSVVETATVQKSTKDIPFDHVGIYGFYFFLPHCYVYRIASGTIVSYLPISPSSPTSLLSDCFFFNLFPNDVSFCRSRNKNRHIIFDKFSVSMI